MNKSNKKETNKAVLSVMLMACASCSLLMGYEFIRSASNSLLKEAYGIQALPFVMSAVPFFVLATVWLYGRVLTLNGAQKTLNYTVFASIALILLCYCALLLEYKVASIFLFLVREVYAILLVEQFWSFINSVLKEDQAKQYNGKILAISTCGGVLGGLITHQLAQSLGTIHMLVFAAALCLPCLGFSHLAYRLSRYRQPLRHSRRESSKISQSEKTKSSTLGLDLFRSHKVLFSILGMILSGQFYAFVVDYNFQYELQLHIPMVDQQTAYSGKFFALVNFLSLLMQLVFVKTALSRFDVKKIHLFIPLINLIFLLIALISPGLLTASIAFLVFKSVDYSLFRAAKELLYVPLPFDARFRAKELIDVFGYRFGKGSSSLGVGLLFRLGSVPHVYSLVLGALVILSWGYFALSLGESVMVLKTEEAQSKNQVKTI